MIQEEEKNWELCTTRFLAYRIAGSVCGELNFAIVDFDGIPQKGILDIFNYLTCSRDYAHVSNSQSVSHVFAALFHSKFATAFFWVCVFADAKISP